MRLLLLLALLCGPQIAFSQTINCLPPAQRIKIADSLRALPEVRQAALEWKEATRYYKRRADSLLYASSTNLDAVRASQRNIERQVQLTQSETAKGETWKRRARRRGLLNWLLAAAVAGITYTAIKH